MISVAAFNIALETQRMHVCFQGMQDALEHLKESVRLATLPHTLIV
jgi:hypothetical protein